MNFAFYIAKRYLVSKKSKNIINIISLISVFGVAVGTMALIVILSVFNGFDDLIKSLFNTFDPEIEITIKEGKSFELPNSMLVQLENIDGVLHVAQVVEENVLLKYDEKFHPGIVKGVSENYESITGIDSMLVDGEFVLKDESNNYAVIGQGVAYFLSIGLNFVSPIQIYVPKENASISMDPSQAFSRKYIYPAGIFAIQQEFDTKYVLVPIDFAKDLLGYKNQINALELKLSADADQKEIKESIKLLLGESFCVKDRFEQNELLYKIMKSEKWAIFLILTFILIIASFNIIGSLTMLIIDKQEDISILQSMGADYALVRRIFLFEGWLISIAGAFIGLFLGFFVCWLQQTFGIIPIDSAGNFIISSYPVKMAFGDFIFVLLTVIAIGFLAAWYPVHYITRRFVTSYTI
jgi:lipoprotein-releasing system permease protein